MKKNIALLLIITSLGALTACGETSGEAASASDTEDTLAAEDNSSDENKTTDSAEGESAANNADATTIVVGTGNSYEPYCYLDENGNPAGYELEVLKAVDDLLPQYEFEYQTSQFSDVLVALDAGQIDIAAHQYEKNPEREKKYLFGTESYTTYVTYPVVLTDNDTIKSLDDLQGKTVFGGSASSNSTYMLTQYNNEHTDNPIIIKNIESPSKEEEASGLKNKVWDAAILTERDMDIYNREYGNGTDFLKLVDDPLQTSSTYWLYDKDNTQLQSDVDGALKELKESGKLSEISIEVLGGDYTK